MFAREFLKVINVCMVSEGRKKLKDKEKKRRIGGGSSEEDASNTAKAVRKKQKKGTPGASGGGGTVGNGGGSGGSGSSGGGAGGGSDSATGGLAGVLPGLAGITHPSDVLDMPVDPNEPTYCLCHQVSYGEMIGCDNPDVSILYMFDYYYIYYSNFFKNRI